MKFSVTVNKYGEQPVVNVVDAPNAEVARIGAPIPVSWKDKDFEVYVHKISPSTVEEGLGEISESILELSKVLKEDLEFRKSQLVNYSLNQPSMLPDELGQKFGINYVGKD